jgi:hypothetical protein
MRAACIANTVAIGFLLAGCPKPIPAWRELQFTRSQPAEQDIIGTWRPTAETLSEIRARGQYATAEPELILRDDQTFMMRDMPDWWRDGFGRSHGKLESGEGRWDLASAEGVSQIWVVRLRFSPPSSETSIHLYRQRAPYLIFIRVGDPDTGDAMFFERSGA